MVANMKYNIEPNATHFSNLGEFQNKTMLAKSAKPKTSILFASACAFETLLTKEGLRSCSALGGCVLRFVTDPVF
jgi:hypothetical protein